MKEHGATKRVVMGDKPQTQDDMDPFKSHKPAFGERRAGLSAPDCKSGSHD